MNKYHPGDTDAATVTFCLISSGKSPMNLRRSLFGYTTNIMISSKTTMLTPKHIIRPSFTLSGISESKICAIPTITERIQKKHPSIMLRASQ